MLTKPLERTHHDSRDCRPSHTSTDSTSAFYLDASSLPSPTTPDTVPDSPSSLPTSSDFPAPPHFVPSNILLDASPSKSSLPSPLLTSTFSPFDLLKVPFAHHTLKRSSKRPRPRRQSLLPHPVRLVHPQEIRSVVAVLVSNP